MKQKLIISNSDGGEVYDAIKPHLKLKKIPITITNLDLTKRNFYYVDKENAYIEVSEYIGKDLIKGKSLNIYYSAIGEIIKDIHKRNIKISRLA